MSAYDPWWLAGREGDPRWLWMRGALEEIYEALGRGDQVQSLTVTFEDPDFEVVVYGKCQGDGEMRRFVCADPGAASAAFNGAYVDVTPDSDPDLARGDAP